MDDEQLSRARSSRPPPGGTTTPTRAPGAELEAARQAAGPRDTAADG